jgi:hypothetical protein
VLDFGLAKSSALAGEDPTISVGDTAVSASSAPRI